MGALVFRCVRIDVPLGVNETNISAERIEYPTGLRKVAHLFGRMGEV